MTRSSSKASISDPALEGARGTDIVIPIMGETGTGKSTFINLLLNHLNYVREPVEVSDDVDSCTLNIEAVVIEGHTAPDGAHFLNLDNEHRLVIVDTPGFNDSSASDFLILKRIAKWLEQSHRRKMSIGGVVYLYDISHSRFTGTAQRNLSMFKSLCGEAAFEKVVLVTTMWDKGAIEESIRREDQLKQKHWEVLLLPGPNGAPGAHVMRLDKDKNVNSSTRAASAWNVIQHILLRMDERMTQKALGSMLQVQEELQIQDELVNRGKSFQETEAAKELRRQLEEALQAQKEVLALEEQAGQGDPKANAEIQKKRETIREIQVAIRENKTPFFSRFAQFWRRRWKS